MYINLIANNLIQRIEFEKENLQCYFIQKLNLDYIYITFKKSDKDQNN